MEQQSSVALAAHGLDEDGEVHFASARNIEAVGGVAVLNAERNILEQLLVQTLTDLTRGHKFALATCKRAVVYRKCHLQRRLADLYELERLGRVKCRYGIADGDILNAREADDIAYLCLGDGLSAETVYLIERNYARALGRCVGGVVVRDVDILILLDNAALDPAYTYSADIFVVVDGRNQQLEGRILVALGSGMYSRMVLKSGLRSVPFS